MKRRKNGAAALMAAAFACLAGLAHAQSKDRSVQLITLDPGHFHAALVQKFMLPGVAPEVLVFAPEGDDVAQHLKRVESFNARADKPTRWVEKVYTGPDYLGKAVLAAQGGNSRSTVVVISGNNARKTEYITAFINAGTNVLADKPMVIRPENYAQLEADFATAKKKGVLLYDIMTERFEITTMLQRALSQQSKLFGTLEKGTPDNPSISKISVHNFSKVVAGAQLKRPQWFFDPEQQGAGIVDVMTHLVDLVQWEAFPEVTLKPADAKVLAARRWTTPLTLEQFGRVTGAKEFPAFLGAYVNDGVLNAPANGEFTYTLKGVHANVSVTWEFEAPPGAGDTHFSVMRGTRASLTIRQGKEQGYKPVLYVERSPSVAAEAHEKSLRAAIAEVAKTFPGIGVQPEGGQFVVTVPEKYHNGHEAHFTQVTEHFLQYLAAGKLPDWEVPNMLTKYATIMQAYEKSR
ncbi:MAG TPA: putative oxidoreductase C-terminal domain-containing protein [Steroidobacteraceae bacterium]|nr:putative oxidoreductase C-terminal domain-containing protein [Steroidobacteraceae bacterium]